MIWPFASAGIYHILTQAPHTQQHFLQCVLHFVLDGQVKGVILDPSCSGSGTIVGRQDHLLPSWATKAAALQRIRQLHADLSSTQPQPSSQSTQNKKAKPKHKGKAASQQQDGHTAGEESLASKEVGHTDDNDGDGSQEQDAEMERVAQLAKFQVGRRLCTSEDKLQKCSEPA